jgi:citrate lyase subunit beta/citryl-CoA lyase
MPTASTPRLLDLPLRSLLFCPGANGARMQKAMAAGADAVILDLEDAVAPEAKEAAREQIAAILAEPRPCPVLVRVNAADTLWHLSDLAVAVQGRADGIMLPKCAGASDLRQLADRLDALEIAFVARPGRTAILPLVTETAAALGQMDYHDVTPRLVALGFAGEDLASDLGVAGREDGRMNPLLADAQRQVAIAAAAAGLRAIDTPFPDHRDAVGLAAETAEAAQLGFAGKLCIHPAQIGPVHEGFRPPPDRVAWGRAVIDALRDKGVAVVDGKMVDIAHLRLARRYVQLAEGAA